ncbi:RdgB/HAM1 family non-canonical purine NTP pyrophosphatase [Telmatocola sphagniphila]|jgi:XTP/dITP diphosphohydrolase|uniref:dITP/XTP pyrophosphatase n=1 Tax=Telmatocola sphagniphila TaxID=1123043 RepID=A0A8E6EUX3_9BACT|nr:RdgB/HAM1 family non-canonical purine NTP pyrophosphatase [Telmatocola sphagniphila]QVL31852.1 RdgB/HAM1 family non-canonical purine NTP pyrophosphatase [Telmatocola sphagniphila]
MTKLVLGTKNKKKLTELKDLLADLPFEVLDLSPWPDVPDVEETGTTFEENARLKATGFARSVREYVLAEDSGLVVPALKGAPGVYSARYGGTHGNDAANNTRLLAELKDIPPEKREAYYVCTAALADPEGNVLVVTEGRCHGRIVSDYRGGGGFGYDPLFLVPEYHQTFGELSLRVKQALSHRAKAVSQLRPVLRRLSQQSGN